MNGRERRVARFHRRSPHHEASRRSRAASEWVTRNQRQRVFGCRRQQSDIRRIYDANHLDHIPPFTHLAMPARKPFDPNLVVLCNSLQRTKPTRTMPREQQISRFSQSRPVEHVRWTERQGARGCPLQNNLVITQARNVEPRDRMCVGPRPRCLRLAGTHTLFPSPADQHARKLVL